MQNTILDYAERIFGFLQYRNLFYSLDYLKVLKIKVYSSWGFSFSSFSLNANSSIIASVISRRIRIKYIFGSHEIFVFSNKIVAMLELGAEIAIAPILWARLKSLYLMTFGIEDCSRVKAGMVTNGSNAQVDK